MEDQPDPPLLCVGWGGKAKWPDAAEGKTVAAFLCLFGMSNPPQRKSYFLLRVFFLRGGGSIRGGKCDRSCTGGGHPPGFWVGPTPLLWGTPLPIGFGSMHTRGEGWESRQSGDLTWW